MDQVGTCLSPDGNHGTRGQSSRQSIQIREAQCDAATPEFPKTLELREENQTLRLHPNGDGRKTESNLGQVAAAVHCCSLERRQTRQPVDREQSSICGDNGSQCGCWSVKQSGLVVFINADMGQRKDPMDGVPGRGSGRA